MPADVRRCPQMSIKSQFPRRAGVSVNLVKILRINRMESKFRKQCPLRTPTNPTKYEPHAVLSSAGTDLRSPRHQIAHFEMQHLSRALLQRSAHRQHLASYIGADQ